MYLLERFTIGSRMAVMWGCRSLVVCVLTQHGQAGIALGTQPANDPRGTCVTHQPAARTAIADPSFSGLRSMHFD